MSDFFNNRGNVVPVLLTIALILFGINFLTFASRVMEGRRLHCRTAEVHPRMPGMAPVPPVPPMPPMPPVAAAVVDVDAIHAEVAREMARAHREVERAHREVERARREIRRSHEHARTF